MEFEVSTFPGEVVFFPAITPLIKSKYILFILMLYKIIIFWVIQMVINNNLNISCILYKCFLKIYKQRKYHRERMRRLRNIKYLGYTTDNMTTKKEQEMTMTSLNGEVIILKKRSQQTLQPIRSITSAKNSQFGYTDHIMICVTSIVCFYIY